MFSGKFWDSHLPGHVPIKLLGSSSKLGSSSQCLEVWSGPVFCPYLIRPGPGPVSTGWQTRKNWTELMGTGSAWLWSVFDGWQTSQVGIEEIKICILLLHSLHYVVSCSQDGGCTRQHVIFTSLIWREILYLNSTLYTLFYTGRGGHGQVGKPWRGEGIPRRQGQGPPCVEFSVWKSGPVRLAFVPKPKIT